MLRFTFIIGLMAGIGALISGLASFRTYDQELSLGRDALLREVQSHVSRVQDRLNERELLTRVAVGLFQLPTMTRTDALQPLRTSIYAFNADFVVASWISRVPPSDIATAQAELKQAGFPNPSIRSYDDAPIDLTAARGHLDVIMDVEPRDAGSALFVGRSVDGNPTVGPVLVRAEEDGGPVSSDPVTLNRPGKPIGIFLAEAVYKEGSREPLGFFTISYLLGPLILANDDISLFTVALRDPRDKSGKIELSLDGQGGVTDSAQPHAGSSIVRHVSFGGREWTLNYYTKADPAGHAQELALTVGAVGLVLTAILCSMFGYVSYNNIRLSREIQTRIGFEQRLTAVIDELNHRVKNILAVIQSIATRTLRHGENIDTARELLIGRIHAMSNVVTLLSDSQWQGVRIRGLFETRAIPNADRISVDGPDITISARAAQSLSLLFYELASHSDEGLSVVGKHPQVTAKWSIDGEGAGKTFNFRWEESNTSEVTRRPDSDFGAVLLDRVAPEALGGTAKRYFTESSYVYELTAPMDTVVDETEMSRTGRLLVPLQKRRDTRV